MYKLLGGVAVLASLSYGALIPIDINLPADGLDHYKATLIRINLDSYIGANEVVESAVLKFENIQNSMEPEANDILHINLLKVAPPTLPGKQAITTFADTQNVTNYFKVNTRSSYTFVNGKSELASYTDNNDVNAKLSQKIYKGYDWQLKPDYKAAVAKGLAEGYIWQYDWNDNGGGRYWKKYYNYTTANFDRILDPTVVNEFIDANGWIGIGLDADCHYFGKLSLLVTTKTTNVPEPASLSLLGLGLLSLLFFRRKKQ